MVKLALLIGKMKITYLINLLTLTVTYPFKIYTCFIQKNIFITLKTPEDLLKLSNIFTKSYTNTSKRL